MSRPKAGQAQVWPEQRETLIDIEPDDPDWVWGGRIRRTKGWYSEKQKMYEQVLGILDEYEAQLPLTNRQIYYRMIGKHGYPKGEKFENSLYHMLAVARLEVHAPDHIPFKNIRDDGFIEQGLSPTSKPGIPTVAEFLADFPHDLRDQVLDTIDEYPDGYMLPRTRQGLPRFYEIWVEAAGMVPQISKITDKHDIPVYTCGGFDSITAKWAHSERIRERERNGISTRVLYIGDNDPSGRTMFKALKKDIPYITEDSDVIESEEESSVRWKRLAVTLEQIEDLVANGFEMEWAVTATHGAGWAVQVEALPPDVLAGIVRDACTQYVPLDKEFRKQQQAGREEIAQRVEDETADWHLGEGSVMI